jgi:hypothetical protein
MTDHAQFRPHVEVLLTKIGGGEEQAQPHVLLAIGTILVDTNQRLSLEPVRSGELFVELGLATRRERENTGDECDTEARSAKLGVSFGHVPTLSYL